MAGETGALRGLTRHPLTEDELEAIFQECDAADCLGGLAAVDEVRRLRRLLDAAAEACRERRITPLLVDLLDAEGFETAPRPPDAEWWERPRGDGSPGGA
jgi:hypothetical protein